MTWIPWWDITEKICMGLSTLKNEPVQKRPANVTREWMCWRVSGLICLVLRYPVQNWHTGLSPVEGHQDRLGLKDTTYVERLREISLSTLRKWMLMGNLATVFNYPAVGYRKYRPRPFLEIHWQGMRHNGQKLQQGKFQSITIKKVFHHEGSQTLEQGTLETVGLPSLESVKTWLDKGLHNLI